MMSCGQCSMGLYCAEEAHEERAQEKDHLRKLHERTKACFAACEEFGNEQRQQQCCKSGH